MDECMLLGVVGRQDGCMDQNEVAVCLACPVCHERRMDRLEWNRAGTEVTCLACGSVYDPNA
jgi:uncharacterized protein YbaR (Trm112 family)